MVIGLTVYLALSLLAALVIFPTLILGSRADRWNTQSRPAVVRASIEQSLPSGDERELCRNDLRLAASGPCYECLSGSLELAPPAEQLG